MVALWRWHAIEESEHKAVAFDVYQAIGGSLWLRRWMMLIVTLQFFNDTFRNMRLMLKGYQGSRVAISARAFIPGTTTTVPWSPISRANWSLIGQLPDQAAITLRNSPRCSTLMQTRSPACR